MRSHTNAVEKRDYQPYGKYPMQSRNGDFFQSVYMVRFNLRYLWINKECVLIMFVIDLKLLVGLMTRKFIVESGSKFKLFPELPCKSACKILELLDAIVNYHSDYIRLFKDVPGEIVLNSTRFHKAATAFCSALDPPAGRRKAREPVLDRARKYTLLLEKPEIYGRDLATKPMTPLIIVDIEKRPLAENPLGSSNYYRELLLYSVRLGRIELLKRDIALALAILALFLLKGEILHNGPDDRTCVSGTHNITDFLGAQAFNQYSPPQLTDGFIFNKRHLWKLGYCINTSRFPKTLPCVEDNGSLKRNERRNFMLLENELDERGFSSLFTEIGRFLKHSGTY
ncbi:hypothetical protein F4859DRAFT_507001 [Xylaria cf. heliscus]|nr:hypothetical protein F4859DRAFT_507001 [Xylaria cf. heliscus]